jgi:hypothetical protein
VRTCCVWHAARAAGAAAASMSTRNGHMRPIAASRATTCSHTRTCFFSCFVLNLPISKLPRAAGPQVYDATVLLQIIYRMTPPRVLLGDWCTDGRLSHVHENCMCHRVDAKVFFSCQTGMKTRTRAESASVSTVRQCQSTNIPFPHTGGTSRLL